MNTQKTSKKPIIITVIVVIVAVIAYFYYEGSKPTTDAALLQTQVDAADQEIGTQVLSLLAEINSLQIDKAFFQSPTYQSLVDHTVEIPVQNVGRDNPFAPIPGVSNPTTSGTAGH